LNAAGTTRSSYIVDLQVEMSGQPCLDPKNHPVPNDAATETIYKLLKEDSVGCAKITG